MPSSSSSAASNPQVSHISIKVDGANLDDVTMDALLDVEVDTTLYTPSMFVIRFHDDELNLVDSSKFALGKEIVIEFPNSTGAYIPVITGEVTSIEPEYTSNWTSVYVVRGYDYSHRLARDVKTETFLQMTATDIVSSVVSSAAGGKLTTQVTAHSQTLEYFMRVNETALELIHRLARRIGYEVVITGTQLKFKTPQSATSNVPLEWGLTLRSFRPRLSGSGQVSNVTVRSWDVKQKREIVGQATASSIHPATGWGQSGVQASTTFGTAKVMEVSTPVGSVKEAEDLAKSILNTINGGFVEAEGSCFGNPQVVAGAKLNITKVGQKFSGTYVVTAATHRFSPGSGYDTDFTVEGAQHRLISDLVNDSQHGGVMPTSLNAGTAAVIGIVTNNKDPDNMGRVKVKFPWMGDNIESGWARASMVGGGPSRGLYWLPEINDEVLLLFEQGDMNRPFIIGGLYNGRDKPPISTASDTVKDGQGVFKRMLKTKKHTITFVEDASDEKIEIKDDAGKTIIRMTSKPSPSKIEIISDGDTIIKGAQNVKVDAANITVNGTTKVDVKAPNINVEASGTLILKGSMVKIN